MIPRLFQSTPPRGRRLDHHVRGLHPFVSIHASAREATNVIGHPELRKYCFNPRLREGGDPSLGFTCQPDSGFNPRLREGGDQRPCTIQPGAVRFNPRLREGGDRVFSAGLRRSASFNPRLREGGDSLQRNGSNFLKFQSTPPRGRRRTTARIVIAGYMFQSTPPRGRRHAYDYDGGLTILFQSTPPRGRRPRR